MRAYDHPRRLTCCVCGNCAGKWRQHWNRDTGYGVCVKCIKWLRERHTSEAEIADLYGKEGVNWGNDTYSLGDIGLTYSQTGGEE